MTEEVDKNGYVPLLIASQQYYEWSVSGNFVLHFKLFLQITEAFTHNWEAGGGGGGFFKKLIVWGGGFEMRGDPKSGGLEWFFFFFCCF